MRFGSLDWLELNLILILAATILPGALSTLPNCKREIFTAQNGTLSTPNFPGKFATPSVCRWIIDSSNFPNHTIYVYFTQLFVTSGFSIVEYTYYDYFSDVGYGAQEIFNTDKFSAVEKLDDEKVDVLNFEYTRSNQSYVVIELKLDYLEGNHLRVLHRLLDVFGFNITYEISQSGYPAKRCTVVDCSLVGHCYADANYKNYKCACFEGFYGDNCGFGPECGPNKNSCENNASCRYIGETLFICDCVRGYTGAMCEIPPKKSQTDNSLSDSSYCLDDESCTYQCAFNEESTDASSQEPCPCNEKLSEYTNGARYQLTIAMNNISAFTRWPFNRSESPAMWNAIKIQNEITNYLMDSGLQNFQQVQILNISKISSTDTVFVTFHFSAGKKEGKRMKEIYEKIQRGMPLIHAFSKKHELFLAKVSSNMKSNSVLEGKEFILTCEAFGTPNITFRWFIDGMPVNISLALRDIWSETSLLDKEIGRYAGILTIVRAQSPDTGRYTCQVIDMGYQQCKSISINVIQIPHAILNPRSLQVSKGDNVSIQCLSLNEFYNGIKNGFKFSYTWHRRDGLVKTNIPFVYSEDLYFGGSILTINNVQKSDTFECEVRNGMGGKRVEMRLEVSHGGIEGGARELAYCKPDPPWRYTKGGSMTFIACPIGHSKLEVVSRVCSLVANNEAKWLTADYSKCYSEKVIDAVKDVYKLTLGFQNDSALCWKSLAKISLLMDSLVVDSSGQVAAGQGEQIVEILSWMYQLLDKSGRIDDYVKSLPYFFSITDYILQRQTMIVNKNMAYELSQLIKKWSINEDNRSDARLQPMMSADSPAPLVTSSTTHAFKSFFRHTPKNYSGQSLDLQSGVFVVIKGSEMETNKNDLTVMLFNNLSEVILARYISLESANDNVLYELTSPSVYVLMGDNSEQVTRNTSEFEVLVNFQIRRLLHRGEKWAYICALVDDFGRAWLFDVCRTNVGRNFVTCSCNRPGLFAVFATQISSIITLEEGEYIWVTAGGCAFCAISCCLSFCVLFLRWCTLHSSSSYLRLQISACTAATCFLFLFADFDPPQKWYPHISLALQVFLLISFSSHIAVFIVAYIDVILLKKIMPNVKLSTISVLTVFPLLIPLLGLLKRQISQEKLSCWWICDNSMLLYTHATVWALFVFISISTYCATMRKFWLLLSTSTLDQRSQLINDMAALHCSSLIFICYLAFLASGTTYACNRSPSSQCLFGSSSALLGLFSAILYIPSGTNPVFYKICSTLAPSKKATRDFSFDLQRMSPVDTDGVFVIGDIRSPKLHAQELNSIILERKSDSTNSTLKKKSVGFHSQLVTECISITPPENYTLDHVDDVSMRDDKTADQTSSKPFTVNVNIQSHNSEEFPTIRKFGDRRTVQERPSGNSQTIVSYECRENDDVLNRISQDLEYLLNGKNATDIE